MPPIGSFLMDSCSNHAVVLISSSDNEDGSKNLLLSKYKIVSIIIGKRVQIWK